MAEQEATSAKIQSIIAQVEKAKDKSEYFLRIPLEDIAGEVMLSDRTLSGQVGDAIETSYIEGLRQGLSIAERIAEGSFTGETVILPSGSGNRFDIGLGDQNSGDLGELYSDRKYSPLYRKQR